MSLLLKLQHRAQYAGDCMLWTGLTTAKGYPRYGKNGPRLHRAIYAESRGIPLVELQSLIRHTCDNPACINPFHLLNGTAAENSSDMVSRQRTTALLTKPLVQHVRALMQQGLTQKEVAAKVGISQSVVSNILNNRVKTYATL